MKKLTTEFRVGIFTILSVAALSYILVLLNSKYFSSKKTITHYTLTSNAKGVVNMTNVRAGGVTVGQVTEIVLKGQMIQIYFEIDSSIRIPEGSKMELRTRGLLGETFLEIVRSPDMGRYLSDGDLIPINTQFVDFSDLIRIMGSIAEDVKRVTASFSELVQKDDSGKSRIEKVFADVEESAQELKRIIESNEESVVRVLDNAAQISDNLAALVSDDPLADLKGAASQMYDVVDDAKEAVSQVRSIVEGVQNGEGAVGKLLKDEELAEDLRETAATIRDVVSPAKSLEIKVQYNNELRFGSGSQHYLQTILSFRKERFYTLGVTAYPSALSSSTKVVSEESRDNETVITTNESTQKQDALRFNAQFGHRMDNMAFRLGVFESSGGAGADVYVFGEKLRLSVEAFRFTTKSRDRLWAQFKLYGFWYILPNIYATFGLADITRRSDIQEGVLDTSPESLEPSFERMQPFVGAGFHFNDEDLKRLAGAAAVVF